MSIPCGLACAPYQPRCKFHSAFIFSKYLREWLKSTNDKINKACSNKTTTARQPPVTTSSNSSVLNSMTVPGVTMASGVTPVLTPTLIPSFSPGTGIIPAVLDSLPHIVTSPVYSDDSDSDDEYL